MPLITYTSNYLTKLGTLTVDQQTMVTAYIAAASESVEKYCRRRFASASYDETYDVGQRGLVALNNFPLITLDKVYSYQADVIQVSNTLDSVSSASFQTSATGITITRTAAGVSTSSTLLYATYPTITLLAAAIEAIGNGFTASAVGSYGPFPSSDLVQEQYSACKAQAAVSAWQEHTGLMSFDRESATITGLIGGPCYSFARAGKCRVKYSAGFSTVPEPIQGVTANMVANMFSSTNGALISEHLGDYSYQLSNAAMDTLPLRDKQILNMYRDRSKAWR